MTKEDTRERTGMCVRESACVCVYKRAREREREMWMCEARRHNIQQNDTEHKGM